MAAGVTLTRAVHPAAQPQAVQRSESNSDGFTGYVLSAGQSALISILSAGTSKMSDGFNDGMNRLSQTITQLRAAGDLTPDQGARAVRQIREQSAAVRRSIEDDRYAQENGGTSVLRALKILDHSLSDAQLKEYLT